jgi:hypothetical protein
VGSDPTGRYQLRILRHAAKQLRVPKADQLSKFSRRVCVQRTHPRTNSTYHRADSKSNHPHTESTGSDWPARVLRWVSAGPMATSRTVPNPGHVCEDVFVVHDMRRTWEDVLVVLHRRTDDGGADPTYPGPADSGSTDSRASNAGPAHAGTDARADDGVANPSPSNASPDPGADAESNAGTDTADPRFAMPRRSTIPAATATSRARGLLLVGRTAFRLQHGAHREGRRQCVWHSATN